MDLNFDRPVDAKTILWMQGAESMDTQDILEILDRGLDSLRIVLSAELARRHLPTPAGRPTPN